MQKKIKKDIEKAVGELYKQYYRLRAHKLYQEEYDSMGTLMNMLMGDRQSLRDRGLIKD